MKQEPGRLTLQRYFAGELEKADATAIRDHLETCAECRTYIEELEAEKKRFLNLHPFEELMGAQKKKRVPFALPDFIVSKGPLVPASVVALLLLFVITPLWISVINNNDDQIYAYKGARQIQFLLKRDGVVKQGNLLETFKDGDQIQVMYDFSGYPFVTLFSIDTDGNVAFYQPDQNSSFCSVPSDSGNNVPFPSSIIIDSQGNSELIVLMYTNEMVKTSQVHSWIENQSAFGGRDLSVLKTQLQANSFSDDSEISTLLIKKQQEK